MLSDWSSLFRFGVVMSFFHSFFFKKVSASVFYTSSSSHILSQKKDQNYESILQDLQLEIDHCQSRLSEIRLRERRATLALTLYTLVAWSAYLLLWYTNILPAFHPFAKPLPVFVGPVMSPSSPTPRVLYLTLPPESSSQDAFSNYGIPVKED